MHEKHEKPMPCASSTAKSKPPTPSIPMTAARSAARRSPPRSGRTRHCFKTLVTVGKTGGHYVFMIPVAAELDLRKAASAAGEKSVAMLPQKELRPSRAMSTAAAAPSA